MGIHIVICESLSLYINTCERVSRRARKREGIYLWQKNLLLPDSEEEEKLVWEEEKKKTTERGAKAGYIK